MKDRLGGRLRLAISGGAPLSHEIAEFFHAIDILLVEGYGLTECTTAASTNTHEAYRFGTVGRPLPGTEAKLAEDGELLIRSETIFQGYYKDPEATAAVLQPDGWLLTGDIAEIDEDGFIKITDRKKDIIVTAGGKNVAPQNLENDLKTSKYVSQALVVGDRQPYIAALITLDPEELPKWAAEQGLDGDIATLAESPQVRELIQGVVDAVNADRSRYEQIKRFGILPRDFTMDDDELTPTLKLKRRVVAQHFGDELEALYCGRDAERGRRRLSLNRLAFSATVHCLTGCAIGEVLGMIIGTALGWSDLATIVLAIVLAFFFGYSLTMLPLLRGGLALAAAIPLALASDTISIAVMEIVDNAIMLLIPGAMEAGLTNLLFWGSLAVRARDRRRRRVPGQPLADRARQGPRGRARAPRARLALEQHAGLRIPAGSRTCFAARSAPAKSSGRSSSYQRLWSRPTAWWCVIVPPWSRIARETALLIASHCSSSAPARAGATNV